MAVADFDRRPGAHPIVPILLDRNDLAWNVARRLLDGGFYIIGFSCPTVPTGCARIRMEGSRSSRQDSARARL